MSTFVRPAVFSSDVSVRPSAGADAERREQIRRNARGVDSLGIGVAAQANAGWSIRRDVDERMVQLTHSRELGERRRRECREALGLREGKRAHDHGVDDREHGGVRADAECERQNRDDGECRRSAKIASGVAQILHEIVHHVPPALRARKSVIVLAERRAHAVVVAKPLDRGALCVVAGESARGVVASAHLEVKAQLVVDVGVDVGSEEAEIAAPARVHRLECHASAGAARSTCVTAPAYRIHSAASARRCARPAALIV